MLAIFSSERDWYLITATYQPRWGDDSCAINGGPSPHTVQAGSYVNTNPFVETYPAFPMPRRQLRAYCTAMVAVLEVTPPMVSVTGTASPGATPAGMGPFTWYKPTKPGARPAKFAGTSMPPMLTVTGEVVSERELAEAASRLLLLQPPRQGGCPLGFLPL